MKIDKYRTIIMQLYLKGLCSKQIYEDIFYTLSEHCSSYSTVKNWIACFQRSQFSLEDEKRSERPISMSTTENIDAVYDMILSDRIGLK